MLDNIECFKYSINNPDRQKDHKFLCFDNTEGVEVISKQKDINETTLQNANQKLIDLITTYKTLIETNNLQEQIKNELLDNVINIVEKTDLINYSSFCVYFQVLQYTYDRYMKNEKNKLTQEQKRELFELIIREYIKNRHNTYCSYGYSDQLLQVMSDCSSSRRKGKLGIIKVENMLKPNGFIKVKNIEEYNKTNKCYLLPDKDGKQLFNQILSKQNINFSFQKSRDNKYPDFLIKVKNEMFILEHKLTNGEGGSQNQEINEIIAFITQKEDKNNIHYISCLQGDFITKLNENSTQPKNKAQLLNITMALTKYKQNYFVNGEGLRKMFEDL